MSKTRLSRERTDLKIEPKPVQGSVYMMKSKIKADTLSHQELKVKNI
jgi:hypothetical protein